MIAAHSTLAASAHLSDLSFFDTDSSFWVCDNSATGHICKDKLLFTGDLVLLEENARANLDARIRPLTHASVDRAHQAKSVGRQSLLSFLIAICRSPNL